MIITPLPIGESIAMFAHRVEMTTTSSALLGKHFDVIRFHTIAHREIQPAYDVIRVRRPGPPGHHPLTVHIFSGYHNSLKTRQSHPNSLHVSYGRNDIIKQGDAY